MDCHARGIPLTRRIRTEGILHNPRHLPFTALLLPSFLSFARNADVVILRNGLGEEVRGW